MGGVHRLMTTKTTKFDLMQRVQISADGCWNWLGRLDAKGYAKTGVRSVHRLMYVFSGLEIPDGFHLHHLCHNKACVNPEHCQPMEPGAHSLLHKTDGDRCVYGHPWTEENTYIRKDGTRQCRACKARRQRVLHAGRNKEMNLKRSERRRYVKALRRV